MSRDVTRCDIQDAVADMKAWANGSGELPDPPSAALVRAMADLLERLLCDAERLTETR